MTASSSFETMSWSVPVFSMATVKDFTSDRYNGSIDPNVEDPEIYEGGPISNIRFQQLRRSRECTVLVRMNDASPSST